MEKLSLIFSREGSIISYHTYVRTREKGHEMRNVIFPRVLGVKNGRDRDQKKKKKKGQKEQNRKKRLDLPIHHPIPHLLYAMLFYA